MTDRLHAQLILQHAQLMSRHSPHDRLSQLEYRLLHTEFTPVASYFLRCCFDESIPTLIAALAPDGVWDLTAKGNHGGQGQLLDHPGAGSRARVALQTRRWRTCAVTVGKRPSS